MSLTYFNYQAYDRHGELQKGQLSAETQQEVVNVLKGKKLIPIKIMSASKQSGRREGRQVLSRKELIDFTQGLTTLMEARVPIDKAH